MRTHPAFICKRIGGVPAGWVPDATEYRPLDAAQIATLNALCRVRTLDELWVEWAANGVGELVGVRSRQHLEETASLLSSWSYLDGADDRPYAELGACSFRDDIVDAGVPPEVELPPSFALRAAAGGLAAWSAAGQRYLVLSDEVAAQLVEWVARPTTTPASWRSRLFRAGILVPVPVGEARRSTFMTSPVHLDGLLAALKVGARQDVRQADSGPVTVIVRPPGSRTPIYLCCCIDSARHAGWMPLALGMLAACIEQHGELLKHFEVVPEFLYSPQHAVDTVLKHGTGIVLMSDYEWTIREHLQLGQQLRELCPDMVMIHGGPSAPKYEGACAELMTTHTHVDVVVRGEGEITTIEILRALSARATGDHSRSCLESVAGLTVRTHAGGAAIVRTPDRERSADLDQLPSPYLAGVFDNCPTHLHGAATIETNRGCPYGCTFCDWGSATLQKVRQFDLERVRQEIDWIGRAKIPILWCADANFGIFERDVEIARMVASTFARHGAPKEMVVNYAKNATSRVATIVEILTRAGVAAPAMISIQTTSPEVLQIIKRSNIKTKNYDALLATFRKERLEVSTDLLIGLPGATVESFKRDLQYYFEREVPIKAYVLTVLPNSPMADPSYMERYRIEKDAHGFVHSTFSYTNADLKLMAQLYHAYSMLVLYGLFKYALMFVQWEHRIRAVDFVHALVTRVHRDPTSVPTVSWVLQCFSGFRTSCGGWSTFMSEMAELAHQELGVPIDAAFRSILEVQAAVLTDHGRTFPSEIQTEHDVVSYIAAQRASNGTGPALSSYPRGVLRVTDPNGLCHLDPERHIQYDRHARAWELESPLKLASSSVHFMEVEESRRTPGSTIFSHDTRPFTFE